MAIVAAAKRKWGPPFNVRANRRLFAARPAYGPSTVDATVAVVGDNNGSAAVVVGVVGVAVLLVLVGWGGMLA